MLTTELQHKIDSKTKPLGALGTLEALALKIGNVQQTISPVLKHPTIVVFAGDHGVAKEGVSAYPPSVTHQMVLNFLNEGAAINVFCKQHNIALKIVDAGVNFDFPEHPLLISAKVGHGTQSFLKNKAMSSEQLQDCLNHGRRIVDKLSASGCNTIGFGEMGIANTSASALIMSTICQLPLEECVGRGTGVDDEQLQQKIRILKEAQKNHPNLNNAYEVLQSFGGFEIAQICGAMLAAYEQQMLILVDGFIATNAFLVAKTINPKIQDNAVFCHLSDEHGHKNLLNYLEAEPLLKLGMRLGEGTGCAVAYPLLESAVTFLNEMASFESAGVSNKDSL
ncbi:nicotinate-nucleotide--dimethylbenzimidazole phosphoribosyltransferase [Aureispira anguillae]|uniref:Nicotinate-nucleotide--dimethylbenzimidazole phosphoribosyltransferase n=1 Tax=Aureispira anguillae TaxID=2864201 RepID=A0A916DSN8_9BACT|nr:nicotinate-nucleotide--dimethylbenzimidazole phosphoribosyltransferase [Aureispira anguillae]BDS11187.1 nicotinate-nucleotide--dimethylbenzimidazole phosphoribosyltransferase [Aureispira anguillae]